MANGYVKGWLNSLNPFAKLGDKMDLILTLLKTHTHGGVTTGSGTSGVSTQTQVIDPLN